MNFFESEKEGLYHMVFRYTKARTFLEHVKTGSIILQIKMLIGRSRLEICPAVHM